MTSLVPLIETYRGGTLECIHFGAVAVTDTQGRVVAHVGDAHWRSFTRSTLKALQALPFVEAGGPKLFGFTRENIAMMCASHSGEPMHVAQVDAMLDKTGLTYKTLQCGCHVPYFVENGIAPAPATALVLLIVSAVVVPQLGQAIGPAVRVAPLYLVFALIAPLLGWGVSRLFRLEAPAGRAIAFSAATRNSLVVLPLALAVPGAVPLLPAIIVTQTLIELIAQPLMIRLIPILGGSRGAVVT